MRIGAYEVHAVETGTFALDGGAMFGVVPWVFWSKTNPPDERQRVTLAARCLLAIGNGRVILIDTGNGTKFPDKLRDIYRLDDSVHTLEKSLARLGVGTDDVTDVILTHLHFDHCGGSTKIRNGAVVPAFPNARFYVQREHWNQSQHPNEKDRASFMNDDYMVLAERDLLEMVDGERELFPGISVLVCHGHTAAQQLPLISDGATTLLFSCDLLPFVSHLPYPYIMAYDLRPLVTLEEKKKVLARAERERWILFLEHDPATEAITVQRSEKGFAVKEQIRLDE